MPTSHSSYNRGGYLSAVFVSSGTNDSPAVQSLATDAVEASSHGWRIRREVLYLAIRFTRVLLAMSEQEHEQRVPEIAITGDLTEHESELTNQLLDVEPGGACTLYFDSPGGSPYCAMSLMTLIRLRGI